MVINKPSGLIVNRAETTKKVKTLQDILEKKQKVKVDRAGIVHRLDKETSGLMVIAKNPQIMGKLQSQFAERKVLKKYLALTHGKVEPIKGEIKLPLKRNPKNRKRFVIGIGGRKAETGYKLLASYRDVSGGVYSLLELEPKTGRTHQIRVHLKAIGHPIVSDLLYLGKRRLRGDLKWCPRLFLHATMLGFYHPVSGKWKEFKIRLPKELEECLSSPKLKIKS